jgi:predicted secreted acid phosphatase
VLRQQLRNYYGDPLGSGTFAADSSYAKEARGVAADGKRWISTRHHTRGTKAILLDVDDTALATWNYELASNWAYNPTTNGQFVTDQKFPAVPGMVDLVATAEREGYAVFFLTGRGAAQEQATLGNLTADGVGVDAGYPKPTTLRGGEDGLFTKPAVADYPAYLKKACATDPNGSCTTIHYKSATRAHIESLGYDIVANFGDQFSDLKGGYADRTFKLPNPNYYLP